MRGQQKPANEKTGEEMTRRTDQGSSKVLQVDAQRRLDGSSSRHDRTALQRPLDNAKRIVQGALHLVEEEIWVIPRWMKRGKRLEMGQEGGGECRAEISGDEVAR